MRGYLAVSRTTTTTRGAAGVVIGRRTTDNVAWFLISTSPKAHTHEYIYTKDFAASACVYSRIFFFTVNWSTGPFPETTTILDVLRLFFALSPSLVLYPSHSRPTAPHRIQDNILYTLSSGVGRRRAGSLDRKQREAGYLLEFQI